MKPFSWLSWTILWVIGYLLFALYAVSCRADELRGWDFSLHSTDAQVLEGVWQAENLADWAMTLNGPSKDPCYYEEDPVARAIIGRKPAAAGVVALGSGFAIAHYAVSSWLDENAPHWAVVAWDAASIVNTASILHHNWSVGIRFFGPNKYPPDDYYIGGRCVHR